MKRDPLFFLALLPPAEIQAEVTAFKLLIAEYWNARHALKSPPHITLQAPFSWPMARLDELRHCLADLVKTQACFDIELNNFGAFAPRVIFVHCRKNRDLTELHKRTITRMETDLAFSDPHNQRPFHPHMTIAHRDLAEQDFPQAWHFIQGKIFTRRFTAQAICLMESVQGNWQVKEQFEFSDCGNAQAI